MKGPSRLLHFVYSSWTHRLILDKTRRARGPTITFALYSLPTVECHLIYVYAKVGDVEKLGKKHRRLPRYYSMSQGVSRSQLASFDSQC